MYSNGSVFMYMIVEITEVISNTQGLFLFDYYNI